MWKENVHPDSFNDWELIIASCIEMRCRGCHTMGCFKKLALDHWRKTGEKLLTHTCYTYSSEKHQRRHNYHLVISVQYIVLCYTIVHASMYDFEEDFKSVLLQSLKFKPLICASLLPFNWWLVNQQTNEPTLQRPAAQIFCSGNIL